MKKKKCSDVGCRKEGFSYLKLSEIGFGGDSLQLAITKHNIYTCLCGSRCHADADFSASAPRRAVTINHNFSCVKLRHMHGRTA